MGYEYENKMNQAITILEHYFKIVWESTGKKWDYLDNSSEIAGAVEYIVNAAVAKAKEEIMEELRNEKE